MPTSRNDIPNAHPHLKPVQPTPHLQPVALKTHSLPPLMPCNGQIAISQAEIQIQMRSRGRAPFLSIRNTRVAQKIARSHSKVASIYRHQFTPNSALHACPTPNFSPFPKTIFASQMFNHSYCHHTDTGSGSREEHQTPRSSRNPPFGAPNRVSCDPLHTLSRVLAHVKTHYPPKTMPASQTVNHS